MVAAGLDQDAAGPEDLAKADLRDAAAQAGQSLRDAGQLVKHTAADSAG